MPNDTTKTLTYKRVENGQMPVLRFLKYGEVENKVNF